MPARIIAHSLYSICLLLLAVNVHAKVPVALYTDLTDGPVTGWEQSTTKGAAISIYGRNFGSNRGSSYVSVGGVDLKSDSDYAEWGATGSPKVPLGVQRITFFLNSSMATGGNYPNTTVTVTNGDGTSNAVPFHTRSLGSNHIYFLDNVGGNDAGTGLTLATAKKNPAWMREHLKAGDICYVKGTGQKYTQHDDDTDFYQYAKGGIFSFATTGGKSNHSNGTLGKSIAVVAYPGDNVEFEAITTNCTSFLKLIWERLAHWTFAKISINGKRPFDMGPDDVSGNYGLSISYFRIVNIDLTTPWVDNTNMDNYHFGDGMDINGGAGSDHIYILGSYIHDICADYRGQMPQDLEGFRSYALYFNGYGTTDYIELGWNEIAYNTAGRGVQFFGHDEKDWIDNVYIHDNWIHDTRRQGMVFGGEAGDYNYAFCRNIYIYNNVIAGGNGDVALAMGGSYGNGKYGGSFTVYNNVLDAFGNVDFPSIHLGKEIDQLILKNNIILGTTNYWNYYTYFPESSPPTNITADHNLYYGAGVNAAPSWDNSTLRNDNPKFVSSNQAKFSDYLVQDSSPVKGTGDPAYGDNIGIDIASYIEPPVGAQGPANTAPATNSNNSQNSGASSSNSDGCFISSILAGIFKQL